MKLKKILASLTAAAMAVTTMAFAPLSVSAASVDKTYSGQLDEYGLKNYDLDFDIGTLSENATITINYDCTGATSAWPAILMQFNAGAATNYGYLVDQHSFPENTADTGSYELYIKGLLDKFKAEYPSIATSEISQIRLAFWNGATAGDIRIKDQKITSTVLNGTVDEYGLLNFDLTKDIGSYPEDAKIKVYYDCTGATSAWPAILTQFNAGAATNYGYLVDQHSFPENTNDTGSYEMNLKSLLDKFKAEYPSIATGEISQIRLAFWNGASATKLEILSPVVDIPVKSVTVTPDTATLKIGETTTLTAEVLPTDATDPTITWTSSDETVATVDENGKVTAKTAGTATIKAVSNADDTIFGSCEVTVEKNTYAITVKSNNDAYGTASADVKEAAEGTKVTLTAVPKTGYKFVEWKSDDVTITDSTFTMPAKEVEITAVFEEKAPDEFDITVAKTTNGTVTVKGGKTASVKDETIDLVITPDKGYEVDTVKVNGEAITGTSFTMPEKDVTIEVTFKKSTYTVTVDAAANGTVTADKATAQMGDTVTVTATPDKDYELSQITVNGTAITGNTFTMPAENVTVAAEFKKIGSADAEVVAPEGVSVSFAGSKEDILKAVFGDDYAALVEAGYKLDVVMTVKNESAVSADDKALVEGALSSDMHVGLIIDVSLVMTKDGVSTVVSNSSKPVSFAIGVPDSIIADGRTYSVIRVHNGAAENIGGTYDAANKTITVTSDKYSTYAVVYKDAPKPAPVTNYAISADRNVTLSTAYAEAGTQINVRVAFGYDAYVYCGGSVIAKITESGSFTMPAGNVSIITRENAYLVMVENAAPNSYIFVYDADMNYIKTNGSVKGIKDEGKVTVKLGEDYAGKTVTLYKGRKSTKVELDSKTLDSNGNAAFTVEGGKNYTAVVE